METIINHVKKILFLVLGLQIFVPGQSQELSCTSEFIYDTVYYHGWPEITFLRSSDLVLEPVLLNRLSSASKSFKVLDANIFYANDTNYKDKHYFVSSYSNAILHLMKVETAEVIASSSWLILINDEKQLDELKNILKTANFFLNSNFYAADISSCGSVVKIYGLYRVAERATDVLVEVGGPWKIGLGFDAPRLHEDFLVRRSDFHGYPIKGIGVNVFPHFTTYLPDAKGVSGFIGDIVTILQKGHNFTLTFDILEGYAYGKLLDSKGISNQWSGMVGALQNKEVDLTVSELSITQERTEVVSYTQPLYIVSRRMYVVNQIDTRQKLLAYTKPMSMNLYVATFCMVIGLSFMLTLMSKLQNIFYPKNTVKDKISYPVALWYMISALLQQGATSTPDAISTRMIFWYGFMLCLVVYTGYSATLVANLAVVLPIPLPFTDFFGLVQQADIWDAGNVKNDLFEVTASQTCFASETDECKVLQKLWTDVVMKSEDNLVTTYFEGLARAKERRYVFIGVDVTTNNYIKQLPPSESCGIRELPLRYLTGGIAIGLQHHSPFLEMFDESLQRLKEMGVIEKLVNKWLKVDTTCKPSNDISADLIDVASLFTLLLTGIGLSLVVLVVEKLNKRQTIFA